MDFRTKHFFESVYLGVHTVFIRDKRGCDLKEIEGSVIGYPKFFTLNNDGQNDTWKVLGVTNEFYSNAVMHIFDRFGKIIMKIDSSLDNWNGMYNGELLQANDYCFSSELIDTQGVVSVKNDHFSLIRR